MQLTWAQVAAVLAVAEVADSQPGELNKLLPDASQRAAFRGLVKTCRRMQEGAQGAPAGRTELPGRPNPSTNHRTLPTP